MKKAVGALRLDLAQYREMEVFTQFSSDLDDATKNRLRYGQGLMRILRQPQYRPYNLHQQVIILVVAMNQLFIDVPLNEINDKIYEILQHFDNKEASLCSRIDGAGKLSDEDKERILEVAKTLV